MRTGEIIAIVVLAIILLIAVSYIIIKYGIKYFKRNQTYGGGWFSRKPKTTVPVATNTGTAVPKKPGFFQRQKARWNDPNSIRRQMTNQLANQAITTGALVATTAAMNAVAPGTAVDPNLILQQGMQQGMNVVQTGMQQGMQQGMNYVQNGVQTGMNTLQNGINNIQNGVQTGMNTLQNGMNTVQNGIQQGMNNIQNGMNTLQNGVQQGIVQN